MDEMGEDKTASVRAGRYADHNSIGSPKATPFEQSEIYGEMDEWFKSTVY